MTTPLYLAFLWHLHQPEYRDLVAGRAFLPWVRLHGASSLVHLVDVLADAPGARVTVNVVPSLTSQLEAWAAGGPVDGWAALATAPRWSPPERAFVARHFFSTELAPAAARFPAFGPLIDRRGAAAGWSDDDLRALAGLFTLSWTDPGRVAREPAVAHLAERGVPFGVDDLTALHAFQRRLAGDVLPGLRRLGASGQVELSTTPAYHPILPLVVDSDSAREATPDLSLPEPALRLPEDARWHLSAAVRSHRETFGRAPAGVWPSEGAVSQAMLDVLPPETRWIATDQAILARSLPAASDRSTPDSRLYRPHLVQAGGRDVAVFFRDRELSDRIGFAYRSISAEAAVRDLVEYAHTVRARLPDGPAVMTVALDGDNPWQGYGDFGDAFLRGLYRRLAEEPGLELTTFSAYLDRHPPADRLARLAAGSWIHGDLTTWIGDPPQNRAWELLARARADLAVAEPDPAAAPIAWASLHAAEGSDWFWWYGHRHHSNEDAEFDRTFRTHLANAYRARGADVPAPFAAPIAVTADLADTLGAEGAMARGA